MYKEKLDFYSPTSLKSYNLDQNMRYQLQMLDNLDNVTRKHCENVANLTCRICEYLKCSKEFTTYCTTCAYLHDIGKLRIPSKILQKPTRLTDEEYEVIKTHTTLGYEICMKDLKLRPYAAGALYHHEALDGTGYPKGLKNNEIPYEGQIIRVADEYDAITSKRQYKSHISISETLKIMVKDAQPDTGNPIGASSKVGKINKKILKALFKVVIDDILYEITGIIGYLDYLKEQIKRLEIIEKYKEKMDKSDKDKTKQYYLEGINLLLESDETIENFKSVLGEYKNALNVRQERIDKLYDEIKIIKKIKI